MQLTRVQLQIDPNLHGKDKREREVCYEVWVPGGDVVRISKSASGAWAWTKPFELMTEADDPADHTGKQSAVMSIEFVIDPRAFRSASCSADLPTYDRYGKTMHAEAGGRRAGDGGPAERPKTAAPLRACLSSRSHHQVAFGVYTYVKAPRRRGNPDLVWQWVSASLVPWSVLAVERETAGFAMEMFMWSDMRMKVESVSGRGERLVVRRSGTLPGAQALRNQLSSDVERVMNEYVIREFEAMSTRPISKSVPSSLRRHVEIARVATFCKHLEGLPYDVRDRIKVGGADGGFLEQFNTGATAQSWYYYQKPVVTEEWLLLHLTQTMDLCGGYDSGSYVKHVNAIISGAEWSEANHHTYQRLLTDVIRVVTVQPASQPYTSDERWSEETDESMPSDTFTRSLTVPGDCEDGANSAYLIYMSILFGKWTNPKVRALQKLAAVVGMPVCITGTAQNPLTGDPGGMHAYAAAIPFPRFVRALFGSRDETVTSECMAAFKRRFGFAYPPDLTLDAAAIETTVVAGPLTRFHESTNANVGRLLALRKFAEHDMGEDSCAYRNFAFPHVQSDDVACHAYAVKCFTTAHREMFYRGDGADGFRALPRLVGDDTDSRFGTEYSCTFAFQRPKSRAVGVHRNELYRSDPEFAWELRATAPMSKEVWLADNRLADACVRPIVPLVVRAYDPFKEHGACSAVSMYYRKEVGPLPHTTVFLYDTMKPYKDAATGEVRTALQKVAVDLKDRLGAREFTTRPWGTHTAFVFSGFDEEDEDEAHHKGV